jgi:predicted DNA-binding transcriptional regulator AlpA
MSTPVSKKSPTSPSLSKPPPYIYAGLNETGRICLKRDSKTLLINGAVYASTNPVEGQTKVVLVPLNTTPGYQRDSQHKKYLARTATGETFRVIGTVEKVQVSATPIVKKSIRTIIHSSSDIGSQPAPTVSPTKPSIAAPIRPASQPKPAEQAAPDTKKEAKLARLQKEFDRVTAQRAKGDDPTVRMAFAAYYLGESESNLYRRRAEGQFPQPIMRGHTFNHFFGIDPGMPERLHLLKEDGADTVLATAHVVQC